MRRNLSTMAEKPALEEAGPRAASSGAAGAIEKVPPETAFADVCVFNLLYRTHGDALRRFVKKRVGNEEDAADIVQDVFLKVSARYEGKPAHELKAILFRAAHNAALDFLMLEDTKKRRAALDVERLSPVMPCDDAISPERTVLDRDLLEVARRTLADMSPRRREILLLHRLEEVEYSEIARRMGVSISTVTREIAGAVAAIKKKMPR